MEQSMVVTELYQKIDALAAQVAYLTEQAQIAERSRESRQELVDKLMPITHEMAQITAEQIDEIREDLDLEALVRLLKKLARHTSQFETLLDQLDSAADLLDVTGQITKEAMSKTIEVMDRLERKGYFAFARGGARLVDNVVSSFTEEDVNRLGDNIVLILNTIKDMTQPEILNFLRNTLLVAEREVEKPVDISYLSLLRQLNDPAVRRGLALTLRVLRVIGEQAA